ncbi:MAG: hypothetical protein AB8C46_08700 [Burkholderiaceae bacterium]
MEMIKIAERAQALYESHGSKAEAEAAQKSREFEEKGNREAAEAWRAIRKAISAIRGAPES